MSLENIFKDADKFDNFEEMINNFPIPIVLTIATSDDVVTISNDKMVDRSFYDKQAVIGMINTSLVDYLSYDVELDIPDE